MSDVVAAVQKKILSGSVAPFKLLTRLGFKASHHQSFLEDYQYFVSDLSSDLGDGIILR